MKHPFFYALSAGTYIAVVVSVIRSIPENVSDESMFAPMAMLSLLVLSVSVMAFLFFSEPISLFIENKKKEAITFFAKTVGFFACFAILFLILFLSF